jgi:hypothetical protein
VSVNHDVMKPDRHAVKYARARRTSSRHPARI